jgi:hypothetical protein
MNRTIRSATLSMKPWTDRRIRLMTAKEKLLGRVMTLSEAKADEALRLLDARRDEAGDEWGGLSKVHKVAFGDSMRRLAESERAAGHEPW